ncbi:MAG: Ig-like domain-containing protein, partial [bacterium]|nr:Ig-like domain-containing protein [bacterium]
GDADPFRVEMLGDDGETVEEAVPTAIVLAGAGSGTEASDTIQVLPPEYRYEQNRRYRVIMAEDIFTAHGDMVDPRGRFPLEFTTGDDGDEEPPRVASTAPLDYQSAGHERPVITVQFDDDVVPATGKLSIYRYDHAEQQAAAEPEQIEYKAAYAGNPGSVAFMIQDNLDKYRIYQAVVSGVRDTSGNLMEGNGTENGAAPDRYAWRFFTGPVVVAVEPASNHRYGFGTFGNPGEQINGEVAGYELLDRNAAIIHGRVGEGGPPSTFFDTTNGSGFPDDVSAIRILHDGRNLAGGLGLTPVCRTITGPNMAPPPKGVFYVDPRWGRFMLPRPAYWSKMESYENATTGAECRGQVEPEFRQEFRDARGNYRWNDDTLEWLSEDEYGFGSVGGLPAGGKFGNCFTMFWDCLLYTSPSPRD